MGGPIAHGVAQAMRKHKEAGGGVGGSPRPPPRWKTWLYVAAAVVLMAALVIGAYRC